MASKGYTDKTSVEGYMLQNINESYDSQLDEIIEGIENVVDNETGGRNFIADSTASARVYDGDDTNELLIEDAVEITKVEVGEDDYGGSFSEVASSGADRYFKEPSNNSAKGVPITKITLLARVFPSGIQNNRITAKWGYSTAVPADIKFATTVLVAGVLNQLRGGGQNVLSEKIGNYAVSYNADSEDSLADFKRAKSILEKYKRHYI